jgi:hypothetical protein
VINCCAVDDSEYQFFGSKFTEFTENVHPLVTRSARFCFVKVSEGLL